MYVYLFSFKLMFQMCLKLAKRERKRETGETRRDTTATDSQIYNTVEWTVNLPVLKVVLN